VVVAISALNRETTFVQNPALGAVLLWRFCVAYAEQHATGDPPALHLGFLVLPLLLHRDTFDELNSTRGSIHTFAERFSRSETTKADILLGVQSRVIQFRDLTLEAVQLAVHCRLLTVLPSSAQLVSLSTAKPSSPPTSVRPLIANAEKLGKWFSSMTLFEIENVLRVAF
jgi:ABC-three component (ABC-3C) system Middle Component 3